MCAQALPPFPARPARRAVCCNKYAPRPAPPNRKSRPAPAGCAQKTPPALFCAARCTRRRPFSRRAHRRRHAQKRARSTPRRLFLTAVFYILVRGLRPAFFAPEGSGPIYPVCALRRAPQKTLRPARRPERLHQRRICNFILHVRGRRYSRGYRPLPGRAGAGPPLPFCRRGPFLMLGFFMLPKYRPFSPQRKRPPPNGAAR